MAATNHFGFAKDELRAFTEGDCWALAMELHVMTGWQLVAIGYSDESARPAELRSWDHVGVRRPDGLVIDITGVHDEAVWLASWHHPAYGATFDIEVEVLDKFQRCWPHVPQLYASEILSQINPALAPLALAN